MLVKNHWPFAVLTVFTCVAGLFAEEPPTSTTSSADAERSMESVEHAILERWGSWKSLTADITMDVDVFRGPYHTVNTSIGEIRYLRKDDKQLFRMDLYSDQKHSMDGKEMMTNVESITRIADGTFFYTLTDSQGQRAAIKENLTPMHVAIDSRAVFERLHRVNELRLLPDEEIDGEKVYVVEAMPKRAGRGGPRKTVRYFSQSNGVMLKRIAYNAEGVATSTLQLSKLKLNPEVDPKVFEFELPEGVNLTDRSTGATPLEVSPAEGSEPADD